MAALGLDGRRLKALLRTRARLTIRQFTRERGRIVAFLIALFFFVPLILGLSIATAIGYRTLPAPWPAQLLALVLVSLWLAWIALPLIAFNLNEGMDVTRLLVYPLARRDFVAAMLFGTLFDYPTYFMLPLFLAILVGWGWSLALPLVLVGLLLSYAQMVFSSQLLLTAAGGVISSRRFRDIGIILTALLGSSCYLLQQIFAEAAGRYLSPDRIQTLRLMPYLQWLPPGATARAIELSADSAWLPSLGWLLYAAGWTFVLGWFWWRLTMRLVTGQGFLIQLPAAAAPERKKRGPVTRPAFSWLPAGLRTLALKEARIAWRTPRRRVALLQGILLPFIMLAFFILTNGLPEQVPTWLGLGLPFYALFSAWVTSQNGLGWEGPGLATLLLTPIPRQQLWLAKGLVLGLLSFLPILLLGLGLMSLAPSTLTIAGLLSALAAVCVTLAVTSVASVLFPFPVHLEGARARSRTGGGCVTGLANALLVPSAVGALSIPLAIPLALSFWFQLPLVGLAGSILSVGYGLLLFWLATIWAGRLLLQREPEVLEATRLPAGE